MLRNSSIEKGVIGFSPENQHYFEYKGKPILLITSAEHYGAVINLGFDYVRYFDALANYGLNYTRIYPGAYIEKAGMFIDENVLAPGDDLIVPWARSSMPGYPGGGNKYDLEKWDDKYFERLRDFVAEAEKRDIIVEICFFNCQYPETWDYSPLNAASNIQGVGISDFKGFQTIEDEALVKEQERYIEKIMLETNDFNNVIYEFVDEPTLYRTSSHDATVWISRLIDKALKTEENLPKKHLLAQQLEVGVDFAYDDRVPLIVSQYIGFNARQVGGIPALDNEYDSNRPIELNETAFLPVWYNCDALAASRIESWEFMVGGGAGFNQLNGFFTVKDPEGNDPLNIKIMENLKNLRKFIESFDFIKMERDKDLLVDMKISGSVNCISERGRQYAVYIHHSWPNNGRFSKSYYAPNFGDYCSDVTLAMDKGEYIVEWVEPETLRVLMIQEIVHVGGHIKLKGPEYKLDIALRIKVKI